MGDLFDLLRVGNPWDSQLGGLGNQLLGIGNSIAGLQGSLNSQAYYTGMQQQLAATNMAGFWVNPYEPGSDLWEKKEWDIRFCNQCKITPNDYYIQLMEIDLNEQA